MIQDCNARQAVDIRTTSSSLAEPNGEIERLEYSQHEAVLEIINQIRTNPQQSIGEIERQARGQSLIAYSYELTTQPCGCALFYPDAGRPWPDGVYREAR